MMSSESSLFVVQACTQRIKVFEGEKRELKAL